MPFYTKSWREEVNAKILKFLYLFLNSFLLLIISEKALQMLPSSLNLHQLSFLILL